MKKNWICGVYLALIMLSGCGDTSTAKREPPAAKTSQAVDGAADQTPAIDVAESSGLIVIDVRSPAEWESGHLDGATNIPHTEIVERIEEVTSDKSAEIYLHCRVGGRAQAALEALEAAGFTNVKSLGSLDDAKEFLESKK